MVKFIRHAYDGDAVSELNKEVKLKVLVLSEEEASYLSILLRNDVEECKESEKWCIANGFIADAESCETDQAIALDLLQELEEGNNVD